MTTAKQIAVKLERQNRSMWGVYNVTQKKWMPNPLRTPVDMSPAKYSSKAEAKKEARTWASWNPDTKFQARRLTVKH